MDEYSVSYSTSRLILPADLNGEGVAHGGNLMKIADENSGIIASKYSLGFVLTVNINYFNIRKPVYLNDIFHVQSILVWTKDSIMSIYNILSIEDRFNKGIYNIMGDAYFVFVAVEKNTVESRSSFTKRKIEQFIPKNEKEKELFIKSEMFYYMHKLHNSNDSNVYNKIKNLYNTL